MSIRFEGVHKAFGSKVILSDFNLTIPRGEILFVLGRSGMGKSVTLKHVVGLLKPDRGKVWVDNHEVSAMAEADLARVRRVCGMVFQHPALFDSLTIRGNIAFGLRDRTEAEVRRRVIECARAVDLELDVLDLRPAEISYGMQKRASLARTLAPKPEFLLFDEPTTGLDPVSTRTINQLIARLSRELGVTSVVVSHDMGCALEIADRILVLDQGKILGLGTVAETRASNEPLVQDFLAEVVT